MAEKFSKSILRGLDRLRKVFHEAPEKKPSASKKVKRAERQTSPSGAERTAAPTGAAEAPEAKPDKKKVPAQPWFRHRKRW
jgi:hypothetical protein